MQLGPLLLCTYLLVFVAESIAFATCKGDTQTTLLLMYMADVKHILAEGLVIAALDASDNCRAQAKGLVTKGFVN